MRKFAIAFFVSLMALISTPARAAINECETQECVPALSDTTLDFLDTNGAVKGSVTYGSGDGIVSGGEGYSTISRFNNADAAVVHVAGNGTYCLLNVGSPKYTTVLNGHVYVVNSGGNEVVEADMDCNNVQTIAVGNSPFGITNDGVYLYVVNQLDGNLIRIDPVTHNTTVLDIGVTDPFVDQLAAVCYNPVVDALYVSTAWGFREVLLPGLGTSDWNNGGNMNHIACNDTHVLIETDAAGDSYLVPVANFSNAVTLGTSGQRSVALSPTNAFVSLGLSDGIEKFNLTGASQGMISTTMYRSISFLAPTASPPVCPNGVQEGTEQCDGSDFGINTCQSEGFDGGSLACTGTCTLDTSGCTYTCGNNVAAPTEECDGSDLKNQDCTTLGLGFTGGTLACNSCSFDTSSCTVAPTCNDGNIDAGEDCDGANLGGATCQTEGYFDGTLACTAGCSFDYSGCTNCGNGTADTGEDCDGADLSNQTCASLGYDSGNLACSGSCTFDLSGCVLDTCGNGVVDAGEACDDNNTSSGDGCSNVCQIEDGWVCSGQPSTCTQLCGNGSIDTGEECDGNDLGNATCADFGGEGTLTCKSDCTLDTTGCLACNEPQILFDITTNDLDQERLKGHNLELFSSNIGELSETSGFPVSCGNFEVAGQTVPSVVVDIGSNEYKMIRISNSAFTEECMFHAKGAPAKLYVSIADPKDRTIESNGSAYGLICVHTGENVQNEILGLLLGTLGTAYSFGFVNYNPKTKKEGNFAEIYVSEDSAQLTELANPTNQSRPLSTASFTDGPLYVDFDNKGDLSKVGQDTPPEGCCSTSKSGAEPPYIPLGLILIFMIWSLLRSRRRAPQKVKTRRDR